MPSRSSAGSRRPAIVATIVGCCLVIACAGPSPTPTSVPATLAPIASLDGTASPDPEPTLVDTSDWQVETMPTLGYQIELPPGYERVTDDADHPVPSFDELAKRDKDRAFALQAVADRLATGGGVFGDLGLWAVEPDSFRQVGVLAGAPYRVTVDELRQAVDASVSARASAMEPSHVDVIELPAGTGFLASYRGQSDLADHREAHIRTPNGRHLVVAMTDPGVIDPATESEFLAITGSLAALAGGASGDTPAPSVAPEDGHADPSLEGLLPERVGEVALERRSLNGESLVGGGVDAGGTIVGELGGLVSAPGDATVALAVPASGDTRLLLAAYRLKGVDAAALQALLDGLPSQIWSHEHVGGRDMLASIGGGDTPRTYLLVGGDTLFQVETDDASLAAEALAGLP